MASAAREVAQQIRERAIRRRCRPPCRSSDSTAIPTVAAWLRRRCDWRIADLVDETRPISLYLVVPPSDISRTKPLMRFVLNQIGRRLTEDLQAKGRRQPAQALMMLDEFPALGRLDFFETASPSWPAMACVPS